MFYQIVEAFVNLFIFVDVKSSLLEKLNELVEIQFILAKNFI